MLKIEAMIVPGKGKVEITGQLGEVMQESARAAVTYVRSRCLSFGLDPDFYQHADFHVHFPEGAVPKEQRPLPFPHKWPKKLIPFSRCTRSGARASSSHSRPSR